MKTLPLSFYNRPTVDVAKDLLGCMLCVRRNGNAERYEIVETEAYDGFEDLASHAARGKTRRNEIMFRSGGHIYVYFTYGMHWMLNIVTGPREYPAAVLIRGIRSAEGSRLYDGPAKLTKALGITGAFNGQILSKKTGLWIEEPKEPAGRSAVRSSPRIGVDRSGPVWSKKPYRFFLA